VVSMRRVFLVAVVAALLVAPAGSPSGEPCRNGAATMAATLCADTDDALMRRASVVAGRPDRADSGHSQVILKGYIFSVRLCGAS